MSLEGHFLVATRELLDPNFARAVVLLVQHSEEGAMGLVVYRVSAPDEVRETVEAAIRFAFDSQMGVAVLLSQRLIGAKSFGRK